MKEADLTLGPSAETETGPSTAGFSLPTIAMVGTPAWGADSGLLAAFCLLILILTAPGLLGAGFQVHSGGRRTQKESQEASP